MADKLHNARAILADFREVGDDLWQRFTGRKSSTLWYYACLVNVFNGQTFFKGRNAKGLLGELERTVTELRELAAPRLPWPKSEEELPAR